jgi:hypothetical protein
MVESKMHEPTSTGFDDPNEWSEQDLKDWLKEVCWLFYHLHSVESLALRQVPFRNPWKEQKRLICFTHAGAMSYHLFRCHCIEQVRTGIG